MFGEKANVIPDLKIKFTKEKGDYTLNVSDVKPFVADVYRFKKPILKYNE